MDVPNLGTTLAFVWKKLRKISDKIADSGCNLSPENSKYEAEVLPI